MLAVVGDAALEMRRKLGESLKSIETLNAPIEEATTSSLDALKAFAMGNAERAKGAPLESIAFYRRATELDPNFAVAYARLCSVYSNVNETARAREQCTKAFQLRDRVSERERFYITSNYYRVVENDVQKMQEAYETWSRTYPRDDIPRNNLGLYFSQIGEWERALPAFQDAMRLAPTEYVGYGNTAEALRVLGRYDESRATLEQLIARVGENYRAYVWLYETALAKGDRAPLAQYAAKVKGTAGEMQLASLQAREAAAAGRLGDHRQLLEQVVQISDRRGLREFAAVDLACSAVWEAEYGFGVHARQRAAASLALPRNWESQTTAAAALARAEDVAGAERILRELAKQASPRTSQEKLSLATAEASLALARGEPQRAVAIMEPLVGLDLTYAGPRAMYTRGVAHLANGQPRQAAEAFTKLQKYRGLEVSDLWHTVVHLGLARALAQAGDTAGAKQSYERFFALVKGADPGIPLVEAAKQEYAATSSPKR